MRKPGQMILTVLALLWSFVVLANTKPLTLMLDWFVNPQHAPIIIAQEKGFFKQHGIKVNIIAPADPSDPPKLVAAGKVDIAIGYQPELYLQVQQSLPLVRIGTLIHSPMRVVATLQSSHIDSLAELKGKIIGYSMSGVGTAILGQMLKHAGLSIDDVKLINVHYNLVQALLSHRVDAISGVGRNFEVPEMQLAGHPAHVFYPEKNGLPPFDALIFLANRHHLQDPRLKAFLAAIAEASVFIKQHPQQSWELLIRHHRELNNHLNKMAWDITRPYFSITPAVLDAKRYTNFANWMLQHKLIDNVLPLPEYAVSLTKVSHE